MEPKSKFTTEMILQLPQTKDGVMAIGDLWDCRTSRRVGFNLFGNNLARENLRLDHSSYSKSEFYKTKSTEDTMNKLAFSASASVGLLAGLITISGGFHFEKTSADYFAEEEMQWFSERNTTKITLVAESPEDIKSFVDKHVQRLIQSRGLRVTHIVKEVQLGSRATGSINIRQSNSNNVYKVGIFVAADINFLIFKIDLKISAEVSETEKRSNYEKRLKVSSFPPLPPPIELVDFLHLPDKIHKQMKEEKHYPKWVEPRAPIFGIPAVFILVPIERYIDFQEEDEGYQGPPEEVMTLFSKMLSEIRDFEAPNVIKRKILGDGPRLLKILLDANHKITKEITCEENKIREALLKERAVAISMYLKNNLQLKPDWKEFETIVNEYIEMKYPDKITDIVSKFKDSGDVEIEAIKIESNLLDEKCPLQFFTDAEKLESWMATDMTIKILFRTKLNMISEGIQLRLYKMGISLGRCGAESGISYPSLSRKQPRFVNSGNVLFIKTSKTCEGYRDEEDDAWLATAVLEAAVGQTAKLTTGRFFAVYAELLGISLPMTDNLEHVIPLVKLLKKKTKDVVLCKDSEETMSVIRDYLSPVGQKKIMFVATGDSIHSVTDNIPCLEYIRNLKNMDSKVILGTFPPSLKFSNAQNVFVCQAGEILAICLDNLDTLILLEIGTPKGILNEDSVLHPKLVETNCLSPSRLEFAQYIKKTFNGNATDLSPEPQNGSGNNGDSIFPINPSLEVRDALNIASSLLEDQSAATAALVVALFKNMSPALENFVKNLPPTIYAHGELKVDPSDADSWYLFKRHLENFLDKENPLVKIFRDASLELGLYYGATDEFEDEPIEVHPVPGPVLNLEPVGGKSEEPQNPREEVVMIINKASGHEECPEDIKSQLDWLIAQINHPNVLARLAANILNKSADEILHNAEGDKYYHLNHLIDVVEEAVDTQGVSKWTQQDLLAEYISRVALKPTEYPDAQSKINSSMRRKAYFSLVRVLAGVYSNHQLYIFHREVERFQSIQDWRSIIKLFESFHRFEFPEATLEYIWGNPKFFYLIIFHQTSLFVMDSIVEFQCQNGIPEYIPEPIREELEKAIKARSGTIKYRKIWLNIEDALNAMETIYIRNAIPIDFSEVLLRNVIRSPEFKVQLKNAGVLKYWNYEEEYFYEPWDLTTLEDAIESILVWQGGQEDETELKVPAFDIEKRNARVQMIDIEEREPEKPTELIKIKSGETFQPITCDTYLRINDLHRGWSLDDFLITACEILKRGGSPIKALSASTIPVETGLHNFGRVDMTTFLINATAQDPLVLKELMRLWSQFPTAIPLVVQTAAVGTRLKPKATFKCTVPIVSGLPSSGAGILIAPQVQLFEPGQPFKCIVTIRVGKHPLAGKSSVLNQLWMKEKDAFCSTMDPIGPKSDYLPGMAEFVQLTKHSCEDSLWGEIENGKSDRDGCNILLVNLHGDALSEPQTGVLQFLAKMATAFIVFWMPQQWTVLVENKIRLESVLGSSGIRNTFDICLDAHEDVAANVRPELLLTTKPIVDPKGENFKKMTALLKMALKVRPGRFNYEKLISEDNSSVNMIESEKEVPIPEVDALLKLIRKAAVVRKMLVLQTLESNTIEEVEELLKNENYLQLINNFTAILALTKDKRSLALAKLNATFACLSKSSTRLLHNLERQLSDQVRSQTDESSSSDEIAIYIAELVKTRVQISNSQLSLQNFLFEIGKIYNFCPDKFSQSLPQLFPSVIADLLLTQQGIQIPATTSAFFTENWILEAITRIQEIHPAMRIFVISFVGTDDSRKSALLKLLFGSCGNETNYNSEEHLIKTSGLEMRLLRLEENFREPMGIDAFLVLDSESICRPEDYKDKDKQTNERKFVSLLLAASNLTIIASEAGSVEEDLLGEVLEIALLSIVRMNWHAPNILLANFTTREAKTSDWASKLTNILENIENIVASYALEGGIVGIPCHTLWKIRKALELNEIVYDLNPASDFDSKYFQHEDILAIHKKFLQTALFDSKPNWSFVSWVDSLRNFWARVSSIMKFPSNFQNVTNLRLELTLKKRLDNLKDLIDWSYRNHCNRNEEFIFTEMSNISRDDLDDSELDGATVKRNILIEIKDRCRQMFLFCKFDEGASCPYCTAELEEEDSLAGEFPWANDIIVKTVNDYLKMSTDATLRLAQQTMAAFEAKPLVNELSLEILAQIRTIMLDVDESKSTIQKEIWLNLKQKLSTKLLVIPSNRGINYDISVVHPNISGTFDSVSEEFVEFEKAFESNSLFPAIYEDEYLTWKQGAWLLNKIKALPMEIIMKRNIRIFQNGLIRELKKSINSILDELERKVKSKGKKLLTSFRIVAHIFGIGVLRELIVSKEKEWNQDYNPIEILKGNEKLYFKELERLIST